MKRQSRAVSFGPTYLPISLSNCAFVFHGRYSLNSRSMLPARFGIVLNCVVRRGVQIERDEDVLLEPVDFRRVDVFADLLVELRHRDPRPVFLELVRHPPRDARNQEHLGRRRGVQVDVDERLLVERRELLRR